MMCVFSLFVTAMEANVLMRFEQDESDGPYINVLPREPTEAYKRMDPQSVAVAKKTEKIAFPAVRELVLMYLLPNEELVDVRPSELLSEKLQDERLKDEETQLTYLADGLLKERERLDKLQEVVEEYNKRRGELVQSDIIRKQHKRPDMGSEFNRALEGIERQKAMKIQKEPRRKKEIEEEANHEVIQFFKEAAPAEYEYAEELAQRFRKIGEFKQLAMEMEKCLLMVINHRQIKEGGGRSSMEALERRLTETVPKNLKNFRGELDTFIEQVERGLFDWRLRTKHQLQGNSPAADLSARTLELEGKLFKQVYEMLPDVLFVVRGDRQTIVDSEELAHKDFESFVPGSYATKEVQLYFEKQSFIDEAVESETQLLAQHLKKNHGLMVNYTKSNLYTNFVGSFDGQKKSYLNQLIMKKVSHLEQAIKYINQDYNKLYSDACDGKTRTSKDIQQKMADFGNYEALYPNNGITVHLLESCRRLLSILHGGKA